MTVVIISHPSCQQHLSPEGHPECPERIDAIRNQLITSGLEFVISERDAVEVTQQQLLAVHDSDYLASLDNLPPATGIRVFDDDIWMSPHTMVAARHAAGSGVQAVELILAGTASTVFCNVRPPGHHAERHRAMGFCIYNNIAIAARYALDHGLQCVAILDFDVHQGNGTQDIFRQESRVLFCSSFQHPFYPNTRLETERENIINTPLDATAKGPEFRQAVTEYWLPALEKFQPELLLVSAGFDAHVLDDMSSVSLTEADYSWVTEQLRQYMDDHEFCRGIVSMLEGGYDLPALGRSAVAHIKALGKL
ncbi:histone deacetylase family protein [Gilvimarinus sp. SDUM040013]|uniref:Histone deacetylase family protein n=1 Tax=Gilvimarinus gilvus TaxID=3058038 RepID=A0ABU4RVP2_9GAMM|nr:histone deacetylase family protein [Gilvimarinus sp. SDUM040013]MDO3388223.1 histone deacetylase family protein [Gilvimarinus sp. SDUM040013]MDX6847773.1 histone deacetylase family protein [Gilvimarinus sp. SDUM040013]